MFDRDLIEQAKALWQKISSVADNTEFSEKSDARILRKAADRALSAYVFLKEQAENEDAKNAPTLEQF